MAGNMSPKPIFRLAAFLIFVTLLNAQISLAQQASPTASVTGPNIDVSLFELAKDYEWIVAAVVGGLTTVFGLPLAYLRFRRTRAMYAM